MQDTSTGAFYQSQVSVNQDLHDNGVTDIKLINIDWGQISVNDTTASATAFETWTTTYSDGTTGQSRDRNVYTLVQQNGTWVVSADDHPDDEIASSGGQGQGQAGKPGQGQGQPGQGVAPSGRRGQGGQGFPGGGQGQGVPGGQPGRGTGNPGASSPSGNPQPRVP